ncbi:MAG: hypothetical protein M0P00_02815 [Bacteroidaceae bacterium]|nr:hypothetical protein [Bacteroidaceae bacterium]
MKKIILTTTILLIAATLSAQNKSAGINLSIWKSVSTQPLDSTQTTYLNIGFSSSMNKLYGVGINVLGGTARQDMNGMQISSFANIVGKNVRGMQLAGITNICGNSLEGVSISGLVNIAGNQTKGVLVSGLTNISGENTDGLLICGLTNISGNESSGLQLSGMANITGQNFKGVMTSGLLNIVGNNTYGVQISGLANIAGGQLNGMQISLTNYATTARGVQIGLVNYYRDNLKGFQLGLINANPQTKVQLMLYGGTDTKFTAAVRFKNQLFYTILGLGSYCLDLDHGFSASAIYRAGLELPLYKDRLFISGDLGYRHIETFDNKSNAKNIPHRLYSLQARINLECKLSKQLGLFATGGYDMSRYYNRHKSYDKGLFAEGGIIFYLPRKFQATKSSKSSD